MTPTAIADGVVTPNELVMGAGLPGFPDAHRFTLTRWGGEDSTFSVLHSLDVEGLDFVVVPPEVFFPDYRPELDEAIVERLGLHDADDALTLVILTLGERAAEATANLLGPVVVNRRTRHAAQVVLAGTDHDVRTPVVAA